MERRYLYNPEDCTDAVEQSLRALGDDVELVDVSSWDFDQRRDFYFREIMPLSTQMEKDLSQYGDDRHAGFRNFEVGVLLTDDAVYIAEEVLNYLE